MRNFTSLSRMFAILFLFAAGGFGLRAQENWEQIGNTNDFNTFPTGFVNPNGFSKQGYGTTGSTKDYCAYKNIPVPGDAVGITVSLNTQKSYKAGFKLKANADCTVKLVCEGPNGTVDISDIINLPKSKAADPMLPYFSNEFTVFEDGSYNLMVVFVVKPNTSESKLRVDDFELYQKDPSPKDPVLTVSPEFLNFENVDLTGEARTLDIHVKGENLTSPLTIEVTGEAFSTDITTISISDAVQGYTFPVTFKPTALQIYRGKITVSGEGITQPGEIILTGKGFDPTLPSVTVFSENCGNPLDGNVDIEKHVWQNAGLTFQGVGTVRNSLPSTGYPDASGDGCVLLTSSKNGEPWLQISGITTLNYRDLVLSFGTHIMGNTGEYCPLIVEVSANGINWNKLDSLKWWEPVWEYKILTGEIPACQNLRIRFSVSPELGSTQIRLDDIKLSGYLKDETFPVITGTDLLNFGTIEVGENIAPKTAIIKGTNLKGDLTVTYSGDTVFNFGSITRITKAEAETEAGYQLPISLATDIPGIYTGTITVTSEDASPLLIGLKGTIIPPTHLPVTFYSEHCGAPYAPVSLNKNNWQNLNIKYEGTADVRSTLPSTGYPGASGNGCVFLNAGSPSDNNWFQISQLNTSPYTEITLSFGVQKNSKTVDHADLTIEASANGTDWSPLSIDNIASTDWNYVTAIGKIPACDNLRLRFTNSGGGQFRLDDIKLTGIKKLFTEPTVLITPKTISFNQGEIGETLTKEIVVYGYQLTGDLEVTLNGDNVFGTGDISIISQAEAENGYVLPVSFSPQNEQTYTGSVIIGGGGLSSPKAVDLSGKGVHLNLSTLAELRQKNADATSVYTLRNNDLVVTFHKGFYIYIQDSTAGIMVYNSNSIITTYLREGDIIPEIKGKLQSYNGLLELLPDADVTVSGNRSLDDPITVTIAELTAHWDQYESRLIRIDNVQFAEGTFGTGNKTLNFTQDGNTMACYDKFNTLSGFVPPTGEVSVIGFPAPDRQLYPRSENDIFLSPTGIENYSLRDESVFAFAGTIRVKTKAGEKITVYNLVGQKIAETVATGGTDEIILPGNQLVIVKTANRTVKINL